MFPADIMRRAKVFQLASPCRLGPQGCGKPSMKIFRENSMAPVRRAAFFLYCVVVFFYGGLGFQNMRKLQESARWQAKV